MQLIERGLWELQRPHALVEVGRVRSRTECYPCLVFDLSVNRRNFQRVL